MGRAMESPLKPNPARVGRPFASLTTVCIFCYIAFNSHGSIRVAKVRLGKCRG